jgi:hypothetical protein
MDDRSVSFMLLIIQHAMSVGMTLFSTAYLIPKGILSVIEWKNSKKYMKLAAGVTFIVLGVDLILFLLLHSIFGHFKT